jgi:hypothetical protein
MYRQERPKPQPTPGSLLRMPRRRERQTNAELLQLILIEPVLHFCGNFAHPLPHTFLPAGEGKKVYVLSDLSLRRDRPQICCIDSRTLRAFSSVHNKAAGGNKTKHAIPTCRNAVTDGQPANVRQNRLCLWLNWFANSHYSPIPAPFCLLHAQAEAEAGKGGRCNSISNESKPLPANEKIMHNPCHRITFSPRAHDCSSRSKQDMNQQAERRNTFIRPFYSTAESASRWPMGSDDSRRHCAPDLT